MKPSPQMVKKAARLLVIQCERPDFYHIYDPITGATHHIQVSQSGISCDCAAGFFGGKQCTHALACTWHLESKQQENQ